MSKSDAKTCVYFVVYRRTNEEGKLVSGKLYYIRNCEELIPVLSYSRDCVEQDQLYPTKSQVQKLYQDMVALKKKEDDDWLESLRI